MEENNRILIVDDNETIHEDFLKVLAPPKVDDSEKILDDIEMALFDYVDTNTAPVRYYDIDSAFQGQQALDMIEKASLEGKPYALVFMDVRMPPGWDGIETIRRIWAKFPYTEMVIVTAYSDYSWDEIITKVGETDRLFFLKKPFDAVSVKQLALSLTKKWNHGKEAREHVETLEREVAARTSQLEKMRREMEIANEQLEILKINKPEHTTARSKLIKVVSLEIGRSLEENADLAGFLLKSDLTVEQRTFLESIREPILKMVDWVKYINPEQGNGLSKVTYETREAFKRFKAMADHQPEKFSVKIDSRLPERMMGEPDRLEKVFQMTEETLKLFAGKGRAGLNVQLLERQDGRLKIQFTVADGPLLERLNMSYENFESYIHLDHTLVGQVDGLALGLGIQRTLPGEDQTGKNLLWYAVWVDSC